MLKFHLFPISDGCLDMTQTLLNNKRLNMNNTISKTIEENVSFNNCLFNKTISSQGSLSKILEKIVGKISLVKL